MKSSDDSVDPGGEAEPEAPHTPAPPITNRFLFVDVAALRAKQLRRGSIPRVRREHEEVDTRAPIDDDGGSDPSVDTSAPRSPSGRSPKLERIAMEEVAQGLIQYELPEAKSRQEGNR